MWGKKAALLLLAFGSLLACSTEPITGGDDTPLAPEVEVDQGADAGDAHDAGQDLGVDLGEDPQTDTPVDTVPDVAGEVGPEDTLVDLMGDASLEDAADGLLDGAGDGVLDASEDIVEKDLFEEDVQEPPLPDDEAPEWPIDAAAIAVNIGPFDLTLQWPAASDNVAVTAYVIEKDGVLEAELAPDVTSYEVTGLVDATTYTFSVVAVDAEENASVPLEVSAETSDASPPTWGPDAALELLEIGDDHVSLAWSPAEDNKGVSQYVILSDGGAVAQTEGATSTTVTGLSPWTNYIFTVVAFDAAGHESEPGPSVQGQTTDGQSPLWPDAAALTITDLQATSLTVSWPTATDEVGLSAYEIKVDGGLVGTVKGEGTSYGVDGLSAGETYLVEVRAFDLTGNASAPLKETVTTPDGGPPVWPADGTLEALAYATRVSLVWPTASDDVGVVAYRVFLDGAQVAQLDDTQVLVQDLEPETEYIFAVQAGDGAGNWTEDGPQTTVTTALVYDSGFRRLTQQQFNRTLADLHGNLWDAAWKSGNFPDEWHRDAEKFYTLFTLGQDYWSDYAAAYPPDVPFSADGRPRGGYRRLDQKVSDDHLVSWVGSAMWLALNEYELGPGKHIVLDPCMAANDAGETDFATDEEVYASCVSAFIEEFGMRAFRRPLEAQEWAFFNEVYAEVGLVYAEENLAVKDLAARGLRNVIATITLSPEFLYRVELGDGEGKLTTYELASRLSYHFWNTMPDEELFAAAADGSLEEEAVYEYQVERLFDDPRAQRAIEEFYRDFFRVQDIHDVRVQGGPASYHIDAPTYFNTAGAFDLIKAAMQEELSNLGMWFTRTSPGSYEDMFRSNLHFLECQKGEWDPACAGAAPWSFFSYKMDGNCATYEECTAMGWAGSGLEWDGVSPPVELPEPERVGLLTRLGLLAHDTYIARPIRRGLAIREMLLCEDVPPPESCDVVKPPDLDGDQQVLLTVREKVAAITEQPGTSCAGCHLTYINPFGHALGHFSSMGEHWEKEHMFTLDKTPIGDLLYFLAPEEDWAEIDTSANVFFNGELHAVDGAKELADLLAGSGQLEWCWSREYFRFSTGRANWESDAGVIDELADLLREGGSLDQAFKAMAQTGHFKALYKPLPEAPDGGPP